MAEKPMTKSQLIAVLAEDADVSKKHVGQVLEVLVDRITAELREGRPVALPGLGKITVRDTPARMVRNPSTGEPIEKPAGKTVRMTLSKALKDAVS